MPKEKYLFQKPPSQLLGTQLQGEFSTHHFAITFCYCISSSKKVHASYNAKRTTYRQGKANTITVILQAEKEGRIYL